MKLLTVKITALAIILFVLTDVSCDDLFRNINYNYQIPKEYFQSRNNGKEYTTIEHLSTITSDFELKEWSSSGKYLMIVFPLEPAIGFNYCPVNTNFSDGFPQLKNNSLNYFLFEPHLNSGINF
jgi:hypothetical protein